MLKRLASRLALASALAAGACTVGGDAGPTPERPARGDPAASPPGAGQQRRPLRDEEVGAALRKKASEVLKSSGDKPVGAEVPFELEGRRYVARIEEHYREPDSAEPGPKGAHRGVTIYAVE